MALPHRPMVLMILDGWGYREDPESNAVHAAHLPVMDGLWRDYPHTLIQASAASVGLPSGQMGSSEVGHLNLGAGRVVYQEYARINRAIEDGSFYSNHELTAAVDAVKASGKALHIMGLLSDGGVHSHQSHIEAMVKLAVERGAPEVYVHAFLDGRDTAPQSAHRYVHRLQKFMAEVGGGRIATVVGRYYAMDRDRRWQRVQAAYDLLTQGTGHAARGAIEAVDMAYERGETDEFVEATAMVDDAGAPIGVVGDGDAVVFMNFRSDRARQITQPFIEPGFDKFERAVVPDLAHFVCLTEYNDAFDVPMAFPPQRLKRIFGEYLASLGMGQLRIAETEKYAHVTFFFNGGEETPFPGEDRILIHSPQVATYDQQPEMSAHELTDEVVKAVDAGTYDVIIMNYANADMVGHTGNFDATVQALEAVDECVGRVVESVRAHGGELLVTADHGNAEQMADPETGKPHTAHSINPVPFIYVGDRKVTMAETGALEDVVPTMLHLMALPQPHEMTGHALAQLDVATEQAEGV
ncbi:phosphoglyceromutase [Thiohalorhabdus denitrificans]|uniref:2,3-bisphosphoglycerate-independent phosphoglycerate mutase n=1 Tax=Thiohalorhabdus denitrificans TaxID=381306 RepID=A0A0P9ERD5_9GAMM|nr:2,3-bisphosphoglycerate-independent phosphoglycerate mutase [Thiohalorhabdus denitrificans]KPV41050.1 phosphoglyceromutase [Thiohalorhabdus denitrificans]SCY40397.1 phosphoglycerate mutase [Thiohalorhabdus denitrificans]